MNLTDVMNADLNDRSQFPPAWADHVRYWMSQFAASTPDTAPDRQILFDGAVKHVNDLYREQAIEQDRQVGPAHYRARPEGPLGCGMLPGVLGAGRSTDDMRAVSCGRCRKAVMHIVRPAVTLDAVRPAGSYAAASQEVSERQAAAEKYMADVMMIPAYAMPKGTNGTPLHAMSTHVRSLVMRRMRILDRLRVAVETQHSHSASALQSVFASVSPTWSQVDPSLAAQSASLFESVRVLDRVITETAAVLVLTCTQVDRWLKAEAPGVTGDADAEAELVAAARDWRELHGMPYAGRTNAVTADRLVRAVDAYSATVTPVGS
jgi:hypothetical protein